MAEGVVLTHADTDSVCVRLAVREGDTDCVGDCVSVGLQDRVPLGDGDRDTVGVALAEPVGLGRLLVVCAAARRASARKSSAGAASRGMPGRGRK